MLGRGDVEQNQLAELWLQNNREQKDNEKKVDMEEISKDMEGR